MTVKERYQLTMSLTTRKGDEVYMPVTLFSTVNTPHLYNHPKKVESNMSQKHKNGSHYIKNFNMD